MAFGLVSEVLNAIDMVVFRGKLFRVIDPVVVELEKYQDYRKNRSCRFR